MKGGGRIGSWRAMWCFAKKRPSRVSRGKNGCIIADWILLSKYPFGVKLGHTRIGMVTDPGWAGQGMRRGGCVSGYRYQMDREHFAFKIRKKKRTKREKKTSARRRLGLRGINDYRPHPLSLPPTRDRCVYASAYVPVPTERRGRATATYGCFASRASPAGHPSLGRTSFIHTDIRS